ncbi:NAD-dependent epimerase/dehydratase family protein [Aquabacterium sp.]|uniref:NAD-dependent epimerase/dehydratase family protein n=1 Tax=Aquabacterium sp. TaxID=1872578 RepID=UPI0035ADC2AB
MNILLCGARGFIGSHIHQALLAAGHEVRVAGTVRHRDPAVIPVDFTRDTHASNWLDRLEGIDAVVNAVGILRDSRQRPMRAIHTDTPKALFDACAQAGIRRVTQVSALGVDQGHTPYAITKLAADQHLLALTEAGALDGVVIRPSIVFGQAGASSQLFLNLARLPLLVLPQAVLKARVQPVAVQDLAEAVARLMDSPFHKGVLTATGPSPLPLAAFIASLRAQLGHAPARVWTLPAPLTQLSARMGDLVPVSPWCSDTLAMLGQDNVGPAQPLQSLLGHPTIAPEHMLARMV